MTGPGPVDSGVTGSSGRGSLAAQIVVDPGHGWRTVGLIGTALAALIASWALLDLVFGRTSMQQRLRLLGMYTVNRGAANRRTVDAIRADLSAFGTALMELIRVGNGSAELLDRAAVSLNAAEWLLIRLGAALAGSVTVTALLMPWWLGIPFGAVLGFLLPDMVLRARISRRSRNFGDELPDVLQLVVSSLRSGFTLQNAVETSIRDNEGVAAFELRRAASETQVSGEFENALQRVGARTGSTDVTWLVMAIRLQREVGGNLAEVLQTTADTMRERAYLRRHVRTLSAEGRLSAYILMALPVVLGLLMLVTRPDYIRPLYTQPAGIAMLLVALGLMAVGGLWLRVAVRVDV